MQTKQHMVVMTLYRQKISHSRGENFRAETKFSLIKQYKPWRKVFAGRNPSSVAILLAHFSTFNILTLTQAKFSVT